MKINYLKKGSKKGFSILAGINRPIIPNQVTKLAESIKTMGIVRPVVIAYLNFIANVRLPYVIDGQHLLNALIKLGLDIPYVTIEVKDKKDLVEKIAKLNSSSKSWTMLDYIVAWSSINPQYKKLGEYYQIHDIELGILASILSGNVGTSGGQMTRKLKRGEFKIVDEKHNAVLLGYIDDLLSVLPRMNRFENRYTISEYLKFVKNVPSYNHNCFITKLKRNKNRFILATQEEGKLNELFKELSKNK